MSEEVCKIFYSIDGVFKNGKPDLKKINTNNEYLRYCPRDNRGVNICKDDIKGVMILCMHLFTELYKRPLDIQKRENNDNQYVEYVMMWLSFRLFQLQSYSSSTLIDFFNNQIIKSHLAYKFDTEIKKKEHLLHANLYYMSRLYQLFNEICHITLKYSKNNRYIKDIKNDSVRFYNNYKSLYDYINECDSYLSLLNNLKTQYENFKSSLIKNNRKNRYRSTVSVNLINLPHTRQADKTSTIGFECPKCKKVNSNIEKINPKAVPKLPKSKSAGSSSQQSQKQAQKQKSETPPNKPASRTPPVESPPTPKKTQIPLAPPAEQQPPSPPQHVLSPEPSSTPTIQKELPGSQGVSNSPVGQLSDQRNKSKDSDSNQRNTASEIGKQGGDIEHKPEQSQDGQQQNSGSKQGNSNGGSENSDGLKNIDQKTPANEPEKQPQSETKEPSPPETSQQEQLQTQPGPQNISEPKIPQKEGSSHPNGQSDSKNETKGSGNENGNINDGAKKPGAPSGGTGDPPLGPHPPSQDGKSDITNPLNQSETSSTSGESIDLWSPFFKLLLNGKEYFDKASDFIEQNRQRFNDAKDKITGAYKDAMDSLKGVYSASSDYFNNIINNITDQLNQVNTPKSGSSGNNLPQSGDQSKKTVDPLPHQPSAPSIDSPPIIPPNPLQQNQSSPQPQSITPHPPQTDTSTQKTTAQINVQLLKSPSSDPISRHPWNIIPTTWNGSGDCKPKINLMSVTLVCCTSEQCSLTGVSVTLILIPIILLIVYKYLSSGWRKEIKRKKNMKKVINSIGGKRPVQIIINASSQKKKIIKSINSVYGKKSPLLNIYKLMQADPVPFINLFFLLIFFVYKRKHNSLEL
ncbi:PIR protein CIR protein [Plasmodium vinckei]|uniref:PIR protein CIR protein n=1 Tax=Plasmodium vinckei TaxID=5860 RepID=A0A6V7SKB6_PLAVN|nr:PIR protein CIR protein [Plasmodium vinckei]